MSYARFSSKDERGQTSDVYVYEDSHGWLDCCGCHLLENGYTTTSRAAMIDHLKEHRAAGHVVPQYTINALTEEIYDEGDIVKEGRA